MARISAGGRIPTFDGPGHCMVGNGPGKAAVADALILAVPRRLRWEPKLEPNVRIRARFDRSAHAAKRHRYRYLLVLNFVLDGERGRYRLDRGDCGVSECLT